jgi:type II secretory pathway pseudopilin PulG
MRIPHRLKKIGARILRSIASLRLRLTSRGFTLMETGFALSIAAVMLVTVSSTLVDAVRMQKDAERLSIASSLCQSKMSQLLSRPDLSVASESGDFGARSGPLSGFKYEVRITRENIDLASMVQTGTLTMSEIKERAGVERSQEEGEERGTGLGEMTQTGGIMEIMKIVVTIRYPLKDAEGIYTVTTFRAPGESL